MLDIESPYFGPLLALGIFLLAGLGVLVVYRTPRKCPTCGKDVYPPNRAVCPHCHWDLPDLFEGQSAHLRHPLGLVLEPILRGVLAAGCAIGRWVKRRRGSGDR